MNHPTWSAAVECLTDAMRSITEDQRSLARYLGLRTGSTTPSIVAAAQLRTALVAHLHLPGAGPVDEYREQRIGELRPYASGTIAPANLEEAIAWVDYLHLALRRRHLGRLRINAGDVVAAPDGDGAIVSSIGSDGRVYFRGGKGYGAWPDAIGRVLVRRDDRSRHGQELRSHAENAAARRMASARWSDARSSDLADFAVAGAATPSEIDELEAVISAAMDERPVQEFLQRHGHLLATLLGGQERFSIPQKQLGSEYRPDFVIGDADSLGIRWVLVELETPRSGVYLGDAGTLDKYARKGVDQVIDWRDWLAQNVAYAHRRRKDNGLGLYDIGGQAEGLVVVGRRARLPTNAKEAKRRALREASRIRVHTYDWLLDQLRGSLAHRGPPATNPYLIHKAQDRSER